MTPDERQLISGLFDRMRSNGPVDKDREAESLINQAVRQTPDAAYLLVQSVLAQEHYLQQAGGRIEELEGRMRDLEDELARFQQAQQAPQRSGGGSFLGGLFGGGRQPEPQPTPRSGSVPSFGGARQAEPGYGQPGSPWGQPQQRGGFGGGGFGGGGYAPQGAQPAAQGGGFMRSALTTAAGVAGGMMAANALSGLFKGDSSAQAAGHPTTPSSGEQSPYAVNNDADRQRELNEQQDLAQDAELENEQVASYEEDSSADWGSADDSEY
ncbi:MAG: DUF2076 domain-containing protein [Hyphomicrobiaceae bacterium]|nr:DUF2076 domain-containing protein [Hyphomicrobiaceae bacterium]